MKPDYSLYVIIDADYLETLSKDPLDALRQTLRGGATTVQLRSKKLSDAAFLSLAKKMKKITSKYKVPFIVNDRVLLAVKSKAEGAHVGDEDMPYKKAAALMGPGKFIGVSADSYSGALRMDKLGASCIGLGPVFATPQKNKKPIPLPILKKILKKIKTPVVAIGGVKEYNIAKLKKTGVKNFCFISEICAAVDIKKKTARLKKIILNSAF
jgi:thiamine-phosphate pyrophosphorylase